MGVIRNEIPHETGDSFPATLSWRLETDNGGVESGARGHGNVDATNPQGSNPSDETIAMTQFGPHERYGAPRSLDRNGDGKRLAHRDWTFDVHGETRHVPGGLAVVGTGFHGPSQDRAYRTPMAVPRIPGTSGQFGGDHLVAFAHEQSGGDQIR
jgi:hypothetical protein